VSVRIVSRREWGAQFTIPGGRHVAPSARRWVVIHWPGSAVGNDERAIVRSIESQHRRGQGWAAAPGYNFLVGRSGTIYEGCGRDVRGIHSPPRNTDGFGVCLLLGTGQQPPQAMLNATRALYDWLNTVTGRRLGMSWHGQHFATACPGPALTQWVRNGMPASGGAPAPAPGGGGDGGGQTPGTPRFPGRLLRFTPPNGFTRGDDVRTWQAGIRDQPPRGQGFWGLTVDGIYGPESARAARDFQRREGLQPDSIVGPLTWARTFTIPAQGRPAGR
jgi:hypothetical protein